MITALEYKMGSSHLPPILIKAGSERDANRPVQAKVHVWDLWNFYIPISTFQDKTFRASFSL